MRGAGPTDGDLLKKFSLATRCIMGNSGWYSWLPTYRIWL